MILPPPVRHGSTIGIFAPSGNIRERDIFIQGIRILHELGFETKFPRNFWPGCDYLADNDVNRLDEFVRMWNDSEVNAIMAARGGYGCLRLAGGLKTLPLAQSPKRLVGFSDITIIHNSLAADHGVVSFHGPVITSLPRLDSKSIEAFQEAFCSDLHGWEKSYDVQVLQDGGSVSGQLAGGNLSTIVSTLGTSLAPDWQGKIVVLEDTAEPAYRIDKMLTQLYLAGVLKDVQGIVLGDFSEGLNLDTSGKHTHNELVWKRLLELVSRNVSVWADFPVGHGCRNFTLPLGLPVTMDSSRRTLRRQ